MIQRIQTVYLLVSAILCLVFSVFNPFAIQHFVFSSAFVSLTSFFALFATVLILLTIFQFTNRPFQIKLIGITLVFILLSIGFFIYQSGVTFFYLDWKFYLLPVALVCSFLARKAVVSDEDLVKSSNRLR